MSQKIEWKLWLDDQSFDKDVPERHCPYYRFGFVPATKSEQAIALIETFGMPIHIDFDHDLGHDKDGNDDTAMDLLNHLRNTRDLRTIKPPTYWIHSANVVGQKNIISFMESWKKVYDG